MDYIWIIGLVAMLCYRAYDFATKPDRHFNNEDAMIGFWCASAIIAVFWPITILPLIAYKLGKRKNSGYS